MASAVLRADRGLSLATVIELVLVKSYYAIFVADLGIVKWGPSTPVKHE